MQVCPSSIFELEDFIDADVEKIKACARQERGEFKIFENISKKSNSDKSKTARLSKR